MRLFRFWLVAAFAVAASTASAVESAESNDVWPELPTSDAATDIPAQQSPYSSEPRTVTVYLTYPGGSLDHVNPETGLMLSLHNWGGTNATGTADPKFLASTYNVIAICVDYYQSGDADKSIPYDFGYLQTLDALRALFFVFDGLEKRDVPFAHGRIFAAGGSGGGNVALMANKFAPRTFACIVDCSGMAKLDNDIAFGLPGGSDLSARYGQAPDSPHRLTADAQEIRFAGHPDHLSTMKKLGNTCKVVVSHGTGDPTCPVEHAREYAMNMKAAGLDVEAHFIAEPDVDGDLFRNTGHSVGDRTRIVHHFAGAYLSPVSDSARSRNGKNDFELRDHAVRYTTENGAYVISYTHGYPIGQFEPLDRSR